MSNDIKEKKTLSIMLAIIGISVVFTPLFVFFRTLLPLYTGLFFQQISLPVLIEIAILTSYFFLLLYLVYLFVAKKKTFRKWFIARLFIGYGLFLLAVISLKLAHPHHPLDHNMFVMLIRDTILFLIFVPYLFLSKRIKATFVN